MRRRNFLISTAATSLSMPAIGASAQASRAQTLRIIPQANLSILDPLWTGATVTSVHGAYVFDTLYGVDDRNSPKPQMAAGSDVSADGRVWRFRLREGLRFHDGTPVRALDCIASLKRWALYEQVGQLLVEVVDRWIATDDMTMELRLKRPFPPMLQALSKVDSACPYIMPERLIQSAAGQPVTEMVGSGPYRFVAAEFNPGAKVVYEKFQGYIPRQEPPSWTSGAKVAYFPRVEWLIISDPSTAAAALHTGEVDWWERPLPDLQPALARDPHIRLEILDPLGRQALMRLNCLNTPFEDVAVRRAVRLAVNQESYLRAVVGDDTTLWSTGRSFWPRGTAYYRDAGDSVMPADLDRARAALAATSYSSEKVVILNPSDLPDVAPLGEVTADLLGKLGMNVELATSDWGTVVQRRNSREPVSRGGWSVSHTLGTAIGLASPMTSYTVRGKGIGNFWLSPRSEELAYAWINEANESVRRNLAEQLDLLALDQAGTIPLGQIVNRTAYRDRLVGLLPGTMAYPWNVRPV